MLQETRSARGALVTVREDRWRVVDIVCHDDCEAWQLEGVRPSNRGDRRTLLVPFDRPRPLPPAPPDGRSVSGRRGMYALGALLAGSARAGQLRAAPAAAIDILDYQLEPALACLRGASRLLVADEVGLGKTVQAGLILAELVARGEALRALVLTPPSIAEQWAEELFSRFRLEPVLVDGAVLRRMAAWAPPEEGPWWRLPLAIASIDYIKQPEVLRGMGSVRWDLLVVDEAHTCTQARYRAAALAWLARRARRLVLLTATPHAGDEHAFRALCEAGRFAGEPPIVMFRRTRAILGSARTRKVHLLRVGLGEAEARMHQALAAYTARVWRARVAGPGDPARLAMIVLSKRAASGAATLLSSLDRRMELLAPGLGPGCLQLSLPLDDDGDDSDVPPARVLSAPGLDDPDEERRQLRQLADLAREAARADAKTRVLLRLLSRARQPALVFTEYRDTLERLATSLRPIGEVALLHGGMDRAERRAAVSRFNSGAAAVLLATDAGSHGLNLQAACRLVVNHELPWSPVRLEQRIGRLDRIGQGRLVHAFHLAARGTFEDQVLARLVSRIETVRRSVGLGAGLLARTESQVAEAVMGAVPADVTSAGQPCTGEKSGDGVENGHAFVARVDLRGEAAAEARRLLSARALSKPRGARRSDAAAVLADCAHTRPWRFTLRAARRGLSPGIYALYRLRVSDARGSLLDEEVLPLFMPFRSGGSDAAPPRPGSAAWRRCVAGFDEAAGGAAGRLLDRARAACGPAVAAQLFREARMALVDGEEPGPVQPGLFDRRELKAAEEAAARRHLAAADSGARHAALEAAARPSLVSPPELLVLFLAGRGRRPRWR